MDEGTFGKSQSARDLVDELNINFPHLTHRVGKFIRRYQVGLEHISDIVDRTHKVRIAEMWRKEFLDNANFPSPVDTFVKNIIVANYRDFLKSLRKQKEY